MKNLKIIAVFAMLFVGSVTAVAQEIGYINPYLLVSIMPEKAAADAEIQSLLERHQTEIKRQEEALQKIILDTQKEMEGKTDDQLRAMQTQIQAKQQEFQSGQERLQNYQQAATREVAEKEEALMKPINEKAQNAINKVAKEKGLKYVIDSSVLLYADGIDIMEDVKKELNIK